VDDSTYTCRSHHYKIAGYLVINKITKNTGQLNKSVGYRLATAHSFAVRTHSVRVNALRDAQVVYRHGRDALFNGANFVTGERLLHPLDRRPYLVQLYFVGSVANLVCADLNVRPQPRYVLALFLRQLIGTVIVTIRHQDNTGFTDSTKYCPLGARVNGNRVILNDPAATQLR